MSRLFNFKTCLVALNIAFFLLAVALIQHRPEKAALLTPRESKPSTPLPDFARQQSELLQDSVNTVSNQPPWMNQLRAAGVPSTILAEVVVAENNARWQKRLDECQDKIARGESDVYEFNALSLQRDREKELNLRNALGERDFKYWDQTNVLKEVNPGRIALSDQEAETIYQIKKEYQLQIWELQESDIKGKIGPEDSAEAQNNAHIECAQKIKTLLGQERHALALGADDPASELVHKLAPINPSDSQINDLTKARLQWEQQKAELAMKNSLSAFQDVAYEIKQQALDQARDQAYKNILGAEAFDKLQKQEHPQYGRMKHYAEAWELDDTSIDHVYGSLKSYEKSQQDVQSKALALEMQGQTVDWETVKKSQRLLADQTQLALQNYLGQDRFNKLKRNGVLYFGE